MKIIYYCMVKNDYCYFDWQFSEHVNLGYIDSLKLTKNYNIFIGNKWSGLCTSNPRLYWKPLGIERNVWYA